MAIIPCPSESHSDWGKTESQCSWFLNILKFVFILCNDVYEMCVNTDIWLPWHPCGGGGQPIRSQFSPPPPPCVLGIELRLSGLFDPHVYPLGHLTSPTRFSSFKKVFTFICLIVYLFYERMCYACPSCYDTAWVGTFVASHNGLVQTTAGDRVAM